MWRERFSLCQFAVAVALCAIDACSIAHATPPRSSREHATDVALPLRSDICASVSFFDVLRGGLDFVLSRLCVCVCRDPLMSVRVRVRSF